MRELVIYIFISIFLLALLICALAIFNMIVFSPWLFLYYQRKNKEMPKAVTWFIKKTNNQTFLLVMVGFFYLVYPSVKNAEKAKETRKQYMSRTAKKKRKTIQL